MTSSGPGNSSGTANTAGPSPSSAPSTPSTHTPGDVMSMPVLPHSGTSKPLMMFGTDGAGTLTSPSNQLVSKTLYSRILRSTYTSYQASKCVPYLYHVFSCIQGTHQGHGRRSKNAHLKSLGRVKIAIYLYFSILIE